MNIETTTKVVVALIGLAGFIFGVVKFVNVQAIEAEKPYLEKKLAWCEEAVETAAAIANAPQPEEADIRRFWEMYWGVMGLIEKKTITAAMVDFGEAMKTLPSSGAGSKSDNSTRASLQGKSLRLAHACRRELSLEWSSSWTR